MPGWLDSAPDPDRRADPPVDVALVGGYAIAPTWGDGHHTGYYTFTLLRDRCPCDESAPRDAGGTGRPRPIARPPRGARMIVVTTPYLPAIASSRARGWSSGSSSAAAVSAAT